LLLLLCVQAQGIVEALDGYRTRVDDHHQATAVRLQLLRASRFCLFYISDKVFDSRAAIRMLEEAVTNGIPVVLGLDHGLTWKGADSPAIDVEDWLREALRKAGGPILYTRQYFQVFKKELMQVLGDPSTDLLPMPADLVPTLEETTAKKNQEASFNPNFPYPCVLNPVKNPPDTAAKAQLRTQIAYDVFLSHRQADGADLARCIQQALDEYVCFLDQVRQMKKTFSSCSATGTTKQQVHPIGAAPYVLTGSSSFRMIAARSPV
jgi:hypothetical protein